MLTIAHQLFTINLSKTFLSPIAQKTNRRIFGRTDGQGDSYIPPKLCLRGYNKRLYKIRDNFSPIEINFLKAIMHRFIAL